MTYTKDGITLCQNPRNFHYTITGLSYKMHAQGNHMLTEQEACARIDGYRNMERAVHQAFEKYFREE